MPLNQFGIKNNYYCNAKQKTMQKSTSTVMQMDIFGGQAPSNKILEPHELPKPINGHAMTLLILMHHPNKWVDILFVVKKYLYIKWQTRLGEILQVYPELVEKRSKVVVTRFGVKTDVMEYKLMNYEDAFKVYMEALNVKGGMGKVLNGVRLIQAS
jgi:hypothetical protein